MNFMLQNYLEAVGYEGFYGNNQWFLYEKKYFYNLLVCSVLNGVREIRGCFL